MFIKTLPIIFTYSQLFSELEAGIFLTTLFWLVYCYTPSVKSSWRDSSANGWYQKLYLAWLGQSSLWRAFWPFFILVNVILYYIDYRAMTETYTIASWKTVHGMLLLPIVWWIRSVWLCSQNTRYKLFSVVARTMTLYLILEFILRFYISTQMPQTFFDCRLLILEYGDCV
ncbi:MAG: hypothetical protein D0531_12045 [Methylococcales bacterium]|nr:MAG: hypothetical protein D0531_12045 [Methylococcales bacterium]